MHPEARNHLSFCSRKLGISDFPLFGRVSNSAAEGQRLDGSDSVRVIVHGPSLATMMGNQTLPLPPLLQTRTEIRGS
jgi:hypothetical protein